MGGGGRELNSSADSGDGRGRAVVVVDSDERGDGGITARDSDEPNMDCRGDGGALVAGDRDEAGAVSVLEAAVGG